MSGVEEQAICVIQFSDTVDPKLVECLKHCIEQPKHTVYNTVPDSTRILRSNKHIGSADGPTVTVPDVSGASLKCLRINEKLSNSQPQCFMYVSATSERLLEVADYVDMRKRCCDGTLQVFRKDKLELFEHHDDLDHFFTVAERQWLILHELLSVKVLSDEFALPGVANVTLAKETSLLKECERRGLISQVFPLHDDSLASLESLWYKRRSLTLDQPLQKIHDYFGETIAIYFAFLNYYTWALIIPASVGVVFYVFEFHKTSFSSLITLAIFNLIWSTAFLKSWERRANGLAYSWGSTDIRILEEPRQAFFGELHKNPITDKIEPDYPKWKRRARLYFVSLPIVILCLLVGVVAMVAYFQFEDYTMAWYNSFEEPGYFQEAVANVPTIVYSVAIIAMNQLYKPLAIQLNEWENHRLQSSFDNHLTVKLVLFWFINTFMLMFYTAFYIQDIALLRRTVLTELIVTQAVDQLQETVLPYLMYKWRKYGMNTDERLQHQIDKEAKKDPYEGTFDDFLELFIQYGYVTLFSCVSPLAALLSIVNNVIEWRTDAVKLCRIHQRPFSKPAAGIGAWQTVFDVMGYLAIINNSALIGLCAYKANLLPNLSQANLLLLFFGLEHLLIVIRVSVSYMIPNAPKWVQIAMARDAYQLKTRLLSIQGGSSPSKKNE